MDPLTATLNFATAVTNAYIAFLAGATSTQHAELVQTWLDDQKFWRGIVERLTPGSK